MKVLGKTLLAAAVFALLPLSESAAFVADKILVVAEDFGGLSTDPLNGTSADTFNPGIPAAGGNGTWVASSLFNGDGSISTAGTLDGIAYLDMGDYIEDSKGTNTGMFELELTINQPTTGNWVGLGFTNQVPDAPNDMFGIPPIGVAFAGYNRAPATAFFFGGPGFTNAPTTATTPLTIGPHTLSVLLDLTTYDGVTDFGSVSYAVDGSPVASSEFVFTEANTFRTIAIAQDNGGNGAVRAFELRQSIPEPASVVLLAASAVGVALRSRRR